MRIKRIYIENYKSLKEVKVELNEGVNVFIGKNNTGKSNIIDALTFFSNIAKGRVSLNEHEYKETVFGKDIEKEILFDLEYIISDEEMLSLFSKLQLQNILSFDDFEKSVQNIIRHVVKLGSFKLLEERVFSYFNENEILYDEGFWRDDGMYARQIIENFKEGITNENWNLMSYGAGSPPESLLYAPTRHTPIKPEENLLLLLHDFVTSFKNLNPVRNSPETLKVYGEIELKPDASNLPQVLNCLNRRLFDTIMKSAREIIEEISEIRAPVRERTSDAYLSIVEPSFEDEFTWNYISSGIKEILYLITLLHTTPKGSLLMIEEPEIHLHPDAIPKFLSLAEKVCREDNKQILITTHSPILIDALSFDKISIVTKEKGITIVKSFKEFTNVEKEFAKQGILKSWLLLPQAKLLPFAKFVLITEGRDDVKVWGKFIEKSNLFPDQKEIKVIKGEEDKEEKGGWTMAIKKMGLLKLLNDLGILSIPFMGVLDSDNRKDEKIHKLQEANFSSDNYYCILSKGEIEDYLLDSKAISKVTGKGVEEVDKAIIASKGSGKKKLTNVFKNLVFSEPSAETKELLVANLETCPQEIESILQSISEKIQKSSAR